MPNVNELRDAVKSSGGVIAARITTLVLLSLSLPTFLDAQTERSEDRPVVMGVAFSGNRAIDDLVLAASIATTESSWLVRAWLTGWLGIGQKRYFDEREFRRDVLRLRLLYSQSGFVHALVDTLVRRDGSAVRVQFRIHEGEPVRIRALTIVGLDSVLPVREAERHLPLRASDPFNRLLLQVSADTLRRLLRDRGYPWVEVFRNFVVDEAAGQADVTFEVDPGPRARIGEVIVDGAGQVGAATVRKLIPLRAGDVYRQANLAVSQRDLYRVGLFDYVRVGLADSSADGPGDTLVNVLVRVAEGDLFQVRAGAGFGSVDCLRGLAGWRARNFLGGGRQLDVTARISKVGAGAPFAWGLEGGFPCGKVIGVLSGETDPERLRLNWDVTTTFTQPYFFGRRNTLRFTLSGERRAEFNAYLRQAVGGEAAVTHALFGSVPITGSWSVTWGGTAAEPAIFCSFLNVCDIEDTELFTERRVESLLGLRVVRDRRNNVLDPSDGTLLSLDGRYSAPAIGSDSLIQFTRGVAEAAFYQRLGRSSVLALRLRGGTIVPPRLGLSGQNVQFVPPEQRFYAGGPTTVRGYGQNQLGPVVRVVDSVRADTITSPTGGNSFFVANAEWRFRMPLFSDRVQGGVFVDVGQVIERGNELFPARGIAVTPGLGLRFVSPLGPVRIDVAYNPGDPQPGPLYRREGQNLVRVLDDFAPAAPTTFWGRLQLHFAVGQAF